MIFSRNRQRTTEMQAEEKPYTTNSENKGKRSTPYTLGPGDTVEWHAVEYWDGSKWETYGDDPYRSNVKSVAFTEVAQRRFLADASKVYARVRLVRYTKEILGDP